jgi:hypothetical protein
MGDHIADLENELVGRERRDRFKKEFKNQLTDWVRDIIENYEGAGEVSDWTFDAKDILQTLDLVGEPFMTELAGNVRFTVVASDNPHFFVRIKTKTAQQRRREAIDVGETQWAVKYHGRTKKRAAVDYTDHYGLPEGTIFPSLYKWLQEDKLLDELDKDDVLLQDV